MGCWCILILICYLLIIFLLENLLACSMVDTIDLIFHYGGRWEYSPELCYVDGETEIVENFDVDFLSFTHMMKKYRIDLKFFKCVEVICIETWT